MSWLADLAVRLLTLATLATTMWIFVSTYRASKREIRQAEAFFQRHEEEQLSRLRHIEQSMDSLLNAVEHEAIDMNVRPLDEARPIFNDIIANLQIVEDSIIEFSSKNSLFGYKSIKQINARQRELKKTISSLAARISALINKVYGFQNSLHDV